jgi:glycolate oxidase FAD binding subunit
MEQAISELCGQIQAAAADHTPLRVRAGGSKDFYGNPPRGTVLDPRGARGIVTYEPSELSISARCGTPLAEVEAALDAAGQMLAFEPPYFGEQATIGGCVASGLAGPRRAANGYSYGGVRDFVLGAKMLDGRGQLLAFGGNVMKNVAGYDVARLLTGSLGMLGVILDVSLKVVPKPELETTLQIPMEEAAALMQLNDWGGKPLPISASAWQQNLLSLRLSGSAAAVRVALSRLPGAAIDELHARSFWQGIREHTDAFFVGAAPLWRLSLPSTASPLDLGVAPLIEWGGALRWIRSDRSAAEIRARAHSLGGHATLFRGGERSEGVFTPLSPALSAIHQRLRAQFDPAGIFDAQRMYP